MLAFCSKRHTTVHNALVGFLDANYASNVDNRRSQTGFVFTLFHTAISWKSSLQHVVALSTTELEFLAVTEVVKEGIWLLGLISEFGIIQNFVEIKCDNQSAVHLVKHAIFHERSKHIDIRLHFVRNLISKETIFVSKVHTEENATDFLTKVVNAEKFRFCMKVINVCITNHT